jgi:hypothetical protein
VGVAIEDCKTLSCKVVQAGIYAFGEVGLWATMDVGEQRIAYSCLRAYGMDDPAINQDTIQSALRLDVLSFPQKTGDFAAYMPTPPVFLERRGILWFC